ncbi:LCCL domain-containing protein [Frigoriglobus tundricola]|uniref:LCCL domain-containing protein n=1 Tax=Frigoriglobus tundricola TaxID=2774151 RepID=A0A6M5YTD5_9BACT|nr:LCCL domain-containing protein [Frigoriglobus tundricola]QJW96650.1 hypothetical protein FTUN_4207 [Frigoriglobus tundricola]
MPVSRRLIWVAPVALSVSLLTAPLASAGPRPHQPPEASKPRASTDAEVKCIDDSNIKLKLLDEKLELVTKHGVLQIPVADVRRIEFANRVPADVAEKVLAAVAKLGHADFAVREAATVELKGYRERAYPSVLKALKHGDPEVGRRAEEIVKFIQGKTAPGLLEARDTDVVVTDDSKITGRLSAEVLRVATFQFGDQQLKLADLRTLRASGSTGADEHVTAAQAPGNLSAYQHQFGKEVTFSVTGAVPAPGTTANLWGTDQYTLDSNIATAVVHAGLAKPGETVTVRVRVIQSPPQFVSTFRNSVNSTAYGSYPVGAYEFVRR